MPPKPILALLALAVLGHAVRLAVENPGDAAGSIRIIGRGAPGSPMAHRDTIAARSRPLAEGERINLDQASVPEIARLPRVGVALAKRIAADRATRGSFGGLAGLDRVPGVGPGLMRAVEPHVIFSGKPMGGWADGQMDRAAGSASPTGSQPVALIAHPPIRPSAPLDLNTATAGQLDSLPGIGPARATAILRYRERHGPFTSVADLNRVPGINPALVQRLYGHLQVP